MRRPAKPTARRSRQVVSTRTLPAPIGGWNARDPEARMKETDAKTLENIFPETGDVRLREGSANHSTGYAAAIRALMVWQGPTSAKMFAANSSGIFDATSAGAVGAAAIACTDGNFRYINSTTSAGTFLLAANAVDSMKRYDGTTWLDITGAGTGAITGVTTSDVSNINAFKRRIWLIKKNSMSAYYLATDAVAGAATEFPLGQLFKKGGKLLAMATWSIDAGEGSDDHAVFITNRGEVAIYKGTDPASASTFALIGIYSVGSPLGEQCLLPFGGDLLLLSASGVTPLSKALLSSTVNKASAISDKVNSAFTARAAAFASLAGWSAIVQPTKNMLLVNVPLTSTTAEQFVMNTITGAWCKFTGWNALSWALLNDNLYFGTSTAVVKANTGGVDISTAITGIAQGAYVYIGNRSSIKHPSMLRPIFSADALATIGLALYADFETEEVALSTFSLADAFGALWGSALWGSALWGAPGAVQAQKLWRTVFCKEGYCFSARLQISSSSATVRWTAIDIAYLPGGPL